MSLKLRKPAFSDQSVSQEMAQVGNRLTTEMSSAIKRQEQILQADYWKTGFSGLGLINSPANLHKRPTYHTLGRVNVNQAFPGLFVPGAISARHQKLRERARLAPAIVFSRSRTTLVPSESRSYESNSISPRRMTVPKSTSMQFNDPLLSPTESPFSGLLRLSPTCRRYVDTLSDDESVSDEDKELIYTSNNIKFEDGTKLRNKTNNQQTELQIRPKHIKGRRSNSLPTVKYKTLEPYKSKETDKLANQRASPTTVVITKVVNDRQTKPILKKGDKPVDKDNISDTETRPALGRSNTSDSLSSVHQQSDETRTPYHPSIVNRMSGRKEILFERHREHIIPVIYAGKDPRVESRSDSRKRSVTFNSDNKVHEYVSHEPICS